MSNPYSSFDHLFNAILIRYENAGASGAITVGDDLYRNGSALASCVWGLYQEADWLRRQICMDTADKDEFLRQARLRGLQQNDGESYDAFVRRALTRVRTKYSGGNITDVVNWAMEVSFNGEMASSVKGYEAADAYGPGTIVLVVSVADGVPSDELLAAIKSYVRGKMCPAPAEIYVLAATSLPIAISISMVGGDAAAARLRIESFMAALEEGQAVHPDVFRGICYQSGASTVSVASPASVVRPGKFERIVVGTIEVTAL